jgi:cytidylate kinase
MGFMYVDTGAMYRAVALLALRQAASLQDAAALTRIAENADLRFSAENRLFLGSEDVSEKIRTPEISQASSIVSAAPGVRHALVAIQQRFARDGDLVMEGRDIGTVVFPDAGVKVFLDASPEERALRRFAEQPDGPRLDQVIAQIRERDLRDTLREHSPLVRAAGAVVLDTTRMTIPEVVETIIQLARRWR